jgi:hypothetical protein
VVVRSRPGVQRGLQPVHHVIARSAHLRQHKEKVS